MRIIGMMGIIASLITLPACTNFFKERNPQSIRKPTSAEDLIQGSSKILSDVKNPQIFNSSTCRNYIDNLTSSILKLPTTFFIPQNESERVRFAGESQRMIRSLYQTRVELHEKLIEFDSKGELTPSCTNSIREANQFLRFAEEYLMEWMADQNVFTSKAPQILTQLEPHTMVNPKFVGFTFKTGDVFLVRGKSYVSAMIARIGDEESNFSHLAVLGEDAKGKKYVVESLIQKGLIVTPLEKWLASEDARVALYRPKEVLGEIGQRAGRQIFDHAMKFIKNGTAVKYDFAMNDEDPTEFFCSEVVKYAYKLGSNGQVVLPKYRTTAEKFKGTDYFKDMGIKPGSLFSPSDIEVDPRFDFVAEYRYLPLLAQVRMQDSVLQSVYDWMIKERYEFYFSPLHSGKGIIAKLGRQFGLFAEQLPKHMPHDTLVTTLKYEVVATSLEKNLYEKAAAYKKKNGYSLSFFELMQINNEYKYADCIMEKESKDEDPFKREGYNPPKPGSKFHWFFHNPGRNCVR